MHSFYHVEGHTSEPESARLAALEERTRSNIRRLDRLERLSDEIHTQNETMATLTERLTCLTEQLEKQEARLESLSDIPAKRLETVIGAVITALVSAVVGGALTVFF